MGVPKHTSVMAGSIKEKESVVGNRAQQLRGLLAINYPMGSLFFVLAHLFIQNLPPLQEDEGCKRPLKSV